MRPQVHLQVRQLAEGLEADVALVVHLPVLLLQRIRQRPVAARAAPTSGDARAPARAASARRALFR